MVIPSFKILMYLNCRWESFGGIVFVGWEASVLHDRIISVMVFSTISFRFSKGLGEVGISKDNLVLR